MKKKVLFSLTAILLTFIAGYELAITNSTTPPVSRTNAPSEGNCAGCHGNLNTGPGDILFSLDTVDYIPGNTYTASVQVIDSTKSRYGFEITVLDSTDVFAGSFIITNTTNTSSQTNIGRDYVNHKNANSNDTWNFDWTAPVSDLGPLTFYIAGIGANNDGSSSGDNSYTRTFTITANNCSISTGITSTNVICNSDSTGTIDLTVTGGTAPLSYAWSNGDTIEDPANLPAGQFMVTVTDSAGCNATDSVIITEPLPMGNTFGIVEPTCFGDCDGSATSTPSGGTGSPSSWTYLWSNGDSGITASPLCADTFTVVMVDSVGCTADPDTVVVTEPAALSTTVTAQNASCNGLCDGAIDLTVTGGVLPYTYLWMPGGMTAEDIVNQCSGTFSVTVTDSNGCIITDSATISDPPILTGNITAKVNESCGGACDGSATYSVAGGVLPYTFTWSTGCTDSTCSTICSGTFSVTVTDSNGCSISATDSISGPAPIALSIGATNSTCGSADGSAFVSVTGGILPYSYLWNDPLSQTTDSAIGLFSGSYLAIVSDSNGCSDSLSVNISDVGAPSVIVDSIGSPLCNRDSTGTISISVTAGVTPYTYSWSTGDTVEDITGLAAGTYTITVTDSNNCSIVSDTVVSDPAKVAPLASITNVTCFGDSDGVASASASGGFPPYTFFWQNNSLDTIGTGPTISGLSEGDYLLAALDSNGCNGVAWFKVGANTFLAGLQFTTTNITCNGATNGAIDVSILSTTDTTVLNYSASTNYSTFFNLPPVQDLAFINDGDLNSGTIWGPGTPDTLELTMTFTASIILDSVKILAGQSNGDFNAPIEMKLYRGASGGTLIATITPTYSFDSYALSNSIGDTTYTFVIEPASNGFAGIREIEVYSSLKSPDTNLTYAWTGPNSFTSSSKLITSLDAGSYALTVTDSAGCVLNDSTSISQPDSLVLSFSNNNASCKSYCDATSEGLVSGGTPPYSFSWTSSGTPIGSDSLIDSLCTGTYGLIVTDSNSCTYNDSTIITEPADSLAITTSSTNVTCNNGKDGTASVTVTGGTAPFTYLWDDSNNQNTAQAQGLAAGVYGIVVTDTNGCTAGDTNVVRIFSAASDFNTFFTTNDLSQINDGDENAGTIWGPNPPFSFEMSMTFTSAFAINAVKLRAGQFSGDYWAPTTMELHHGSSAGPLLIAISPTYTMDLYSFTNTITSTLYTWVISTVDSFVAIREIECLEILDPSQVIVTEPTAVNISSVVTDASADSVSDGSIDLTVSGGVPPYTFSWSTGTTSEDLSGISGGEYTVEVLDSNGCGEILNFTVLPIPVIVGIGEPSTNGIDIQIYPNPNRGEFNISCLFAEPTEVLIHIYDLRGQKIYENSIEHGGQSEEQIDLKGLEKGIYLLQITTETHTVNRKIVIQ